MTQELHYTSVPRGLKPGSRGFCTVAATAHLPGVLIERLESISAYQPLFAPHDPSAALNPIAFSHLRVSIGGKLVHVVSRIGPAGLDYTGRPNKYAHHVVLDENERPDGGPAWLLRQPGFVQSAWSGEPREISIGRTLPAGDRMAGVAHAWKAVTGDAGWAGVLAESFLADPRRPVFLMYRPGIELLPLFEEAIALLPTRQRWDVDFSAYYQGLPQGVNCIWRGVIAGSPEAASALRLPNALTIDLGSPLGAASGGALVHMARTGERLASQAAAVDVTKPTAPITAPDPLGRRTASARPAGAGGKGQYDLIPELAAATAKSRAFRPPGIEPSDRDGRTWLLSAAAALVYL